MRLFFSSTRGLLRRGRPRHRGLANSVTSLLLETLPPIFNVTLTAALSYHVLILNPWHPRWQLATFFVLAQLLSNWICFRANSSAVMSSPKNFPGYQHRYPAVTSSRDPGLADARSIDEYRNNRWRECEYCDMHVPSRTHHCGHCGRCIFVLDHHCYFLGHCVGRANMRFFLVFCFYASLGCAMGIYNLINVMLYYRDPSSLGEFPYYVLPYTFVMYLLGKAASFEVLYVAMINFGLGGTGACAFLFLSGMHSVFTGKTPYENKLRKKKMVVNYDRLNNDDDYLDDEAGLAERFAEVFGNCGLLHFLVPLVPMGGEPEAPVGYRRIIVYNNEYVKDGSICTSESTLDFEP